MTKSPTARTMALTRKYGYVCAVVEKFNSFIKARLDLFQCMDIVAIKEDANGVLGIQATTKHNVLERVKKSTGNRALRIWLAAGNTFLVVGWEKSAVNGKEKWHYVIKQALLSPDGIIFEDRNEFFLALPEVSNSASDAEESTEDDNAEEGTNG